MITNALTRRQFLQRSALLGLAAPWISSRSRAASANEKLNIAVIGVANQGNYNLIHVASQNIVALCDVDDNYLAAAAKKFPEAKTYNDFRRLLDQKGIDAVVVATPDHTHAVAAVAALRSGRHVYCEKPLARTLSETRIITNTAREQKLATQMGIQIHAGSNYRRVVDLIQRGTIGPVREVHVWVNASYGGQERPQDTAPVPAHLNYDLWLGPVSPRPYHPAYLPFKWRNWWAFGGGALADMGCHFIDLPHWALNLKYPTAAEPVEGPPVHPESPPPWLIVRYQYPARQEQPPVQLTWYHGGKQPSLLTPQQAPKWRNGVLFIGEKGQLLADYSRHVLLPEKDFAGPAKPSGKDSAGAHHQEWIQACKTGTQSSCNFDYSGPLTEVALLGNVAYRLGKKLEWDAARLRATHSSDADQFIQHQYRDGWRI